MVVVFGKLEDHLHGFLPGNVQKLRHARKKLKKDKKYFSDDF
jgi:hypothetical protein